jgi:PPOX class probable F420-dependent enzyme
MTTQIPDNLADLLAGAHYGSLGTIRPDGVIQVNPMWYEFDGEHLRFTHTNKRAKFRNLQSNPAMTFMVFDPADPLRYLEVRGRLAESIPDPSGSFYVRLSERYGKPEKPPADRADRVILVMDIDRVSGQ